MKKIIKIIMAIVLFNIVLKVAIKLVKKYASEEDLEMLKEQFAPLLKKVSGNADAQEVGEGK